MAILCALNGVYNEDQLFKGIRAALPDEDIRQWPRTGDPDDIDICIVFRALPGFFKRFRNLRLISATGLGVDHYLLDTDLPRDVLIVRVVDAEVSARMAEYMLTWVFFHHRDVSHFLKSQSEHTWAYAPIKSSTEVCVGVMGLGQLGAATAQRLVYLSYQVRGWARTRHQIDGATCYAGAEEFASFLEKVDILINLLPLTESTRGILCQKTFSLLPRGAVVISAGRGGHLVEEDLIAALASKQLRAATIDAFPKEPLPPDHRLWDVPNLFITPHCSCAGRPETIVTSFVENVRRFRRGDPLRNLVSFTQGY
jgi:glyoxylate/hydroxypyruvate reductase A